MEITDEIIFISQLFGHMPDCPHQVYAYASSLLGIPERRTRHGRERVKSGLDSSYRASNYTKIGFQTFSMGFTPQPQLPKYSLPNPATHGYSLVMNLSHGFVSD